MKSLKPGTVAVGIIDAGQHDESEMTTAEIGYVHEFGGGNSPERSFIRSTLHGNRKDILKRSKELLRVITRKTLTVEKALGLLGADVSDQISQKIVKLQDPPNNPETVKRKGSSNPLVDTGQLKNSITWKVGS